MPISKRNGKYYWGSKGPFNSRKKAEEVAQAAHAAGYEKSLLKLMKAEGNHWSEDEDGGDIEIATMPPFFVVNFIIKY